MEYFYGIAFYVMYIVFGLITAVVFVVKASEPKYAATEYYYLAFFGLIGGVVWPLFVLVVSVGHFAFVIKQKYFTPIGDKHV